MMRDVKNTQFILGNLVVIHPAYNVNKYLAFNGGGGGGGVKKCSKTQKFKVTFVHRWVYCFVKKEQKYKDTFGQRASVKIYNFVGLNNFKTVFCIIHLVILGKISTVNTRYFTTVIHKHSKQLLNILILIVIECISSLLYNSYTIHSMQILCN